MNLREVLNLAYAHLVRHSDSEQRASLDGMLETTPAEVAALDAARRAVALVGVA